MSHDTSSPDGMDRRRFLRRSAATAVGAVAAQAGITLAIRDLPAQTTLAPSAALEELIAGNRRFVAGRLTSIERDLRMLKEHTAEKQEPFAAVLACADSRVPVELVFDQTIGQIFVTRSAFSIRTFDQRSSSRPAMSTRRSRSTHAFTRNSCGLSAEGASTRDLSWSGRGRFDPRSIDSQHHFC